MTVIEKRGVGAGGEQSVSLDSPPYAIHNGKFRPLHTTVLM
jgi:alpha-glucosidase